MHCGVDNGITHAAAGLRMTRIIQDNETSAGATKVQRS
jgi:hypothetical protein